MSWVSAGTKRVRKALKIPPITLGNLVKAGAGVGVPGFGAVNAALDTRANKANKPGSFMDALHGTFDNVLDRGIQKAQDAQLASNAVDGARQHGPLIVAAVALAIYLATRKR